MHSCKLKQHSVSLQTGHPGCLQLLELLEILEISWNLKTLLEISWNLLDLQEIFV